MLSTLIKQIGEYKKASIATPLLTALEVVMDVLIPYVTALLIDRGIMAGDMQAVYLYGLLMVGMALLSLLFGIIFEIPVVAWLLARFGMLKASWMSQYRRHAIVAILIIAAVITPTADIMTLFVVSLPIWLLYEASIWIVKWTSPPASSPVLQA